MPKVKIGEEFKEIPWNPLLVAHLLYKGIEVYPDEGLDEETLGAHNTQIADILRQVWGNKNMRAVGDRSTSPPLGNPRNNFPEKTLPATPPNVNSNFINIRPNPYILPEPTIDLLKPSDLPYDRFDFRKRPWET